MTKRDLILKYENINEISPYFKRMLLKDITEMTDNKKHLDITPEAEVKVVMGVTINRSQLKYIIATADTVELTINDLENLTEHLYQHFKK
jgi:hypothetical protein